jgi:hypothetical protein
MLLEIPRITCNELDIDLSEKDVDTIDEFEDAWYEFLSNDPDMLPLSQRGKRGLQIERQIEELQASKQNAEAELKRQLDFFSSSKEQLETNFKKAMAGAAMDQQKIHTQLNKQIDNVAVADHNAMLTIPWDHFLDTLDHAVVHTDTKSLADGKKTMKPSARAMFLVNAHNEDERSRDFLLRAYRIDHALLNAQVKMSQREVERYEKTTESLEVLGKFLTEHNIWGLLTKSAASTMAGTH